VAVAELFWVGADTKIRLAVAPRPRAGDWLEDEIISWKNSGVEVVACLLCDDEIAELGLADEAALCTKHGLEFIRYPIVDRGLPDSHESANRFIEGLTIRLSDGRAVLIHCRAGIGRTGMIAACCLGARCADDAFLRIAKARGVNVPDTEDQRQWVVDFLEYSSRRETAAN